MDRALRWSLVGAAGLAVTATAIFVSRHSYSLYDDAFIYLRYVHNVRGGCGLRWNCGDAPVEGFSGPLYLALLLAGAVVTAKLVTLTQVLGTIGILGALGLAIGGASQPYDEAGRDTAKRALGAVAVAAVLALDHFVLLNAVTGLETSLAAFAATALLIAVQADARRATIGLAFALALTRPEGAIFVLLLPMLRWARTTRVLAICVGGLVVITLVRWSIFHDVVPNTYWAKSGATSRHVSLGVEYLVQTISDFPVLLFAPLALMSRVSRSRASYFLVAAAIWIASVVRAGGDTFSYGRLIFPLVPALAVLAVRGGMSLRPPAAALVALAIGARAALAHSIPEQHGFENVRLWTAIGKYLKANDPGKTIATVPVGAIGYFSQLEVIDLVGLNSREIAKAGRTVPPEMLTKQWIGHERHNLEYTLDRAPDLVVTTKVRNTPWRTLDEASAGFYADWLILRAMKAGTAPYRVTDLAIANDVHVLAFARAE